MAQSPAYGMHLMKMGTKDPLTEPSSTGRLRGSLRLTSDVLRNEQRNRNRSTFLLAWFASCLLLAWISPVFAEDSYDLAFSTYFGGSRWEHARDVCADAQGNVYVCGGTASHDFPTTPGAYDRTFNFGDTSGQECDAFICKFGPEGRLIWATYLGSPGYDRAYGIEVDAEGYVYVAGRSGRGFPTTPGAFQPTFQGYNGGGYGGYQNAFVAKLAPAGTIALDPSRTYQTIRGWEAVAFALEPTDPAFPNFKDTLIDQAVNAAIPQAGVLTVYSKPVLSDSQAPAFDGVND